MTLQTARSNGRSISISSSINNNMKQNEREKEKCIPRFSSNPMKSYSDVSLPSYYMLLSCLRLSKIRQSQHQRQRNEGVPMCTHTAVYANTPCTIAHQRYKILPGEIALISRRMLFPFYTIIIHHLSDKIDPIQHVRVRVFIKNTTWMPYGLHSILLFRCVYCYCCFGFKVCFQNNKMVQYVIATVSVRVFSGVEHIHIKTGRSSCCLDTRVALFLYSVYILLVQPSGGSTYELCKHECTQGMRSKW